jgi:hypothetical protein
MEYCWARVAFGALSGGLDEIGVGLISFDGGTRALNEKRRQD